MNEHTIPIMLTIREAAKKTHLSEHHIRQLIVQKKIIFIMAGRKYLVNLLSLADYLNKGEENSLKGVGCHGREANVCKNNNRQ